jgi:putative SOS response-associated peptidase YedK
VGPAAHAGDHRTCRLVVWLGEAEGDATALLRPAAEGVLRVWPVDKRVGNVRNDGPDLLEPRQIEVKQPALL